MKHVRGCVLFQVLLRHSVFRINLVAQDEEWNVGKRVISKKAVELLLSFKKAFVIGGIDQEHNAFNSSKVALPESASGHVTTQVVGLEANVANL